MSITDAGKTSNDTVTAEKPKKERVPTEELRLLDPATVRFCREGSLLKMRTKPEAEWQEVTLARLFPLTEDECWLSVLDDTGSEVGVLLDVEALPREDLVCVRAELRRRYVVPQISRIYACRDRFDVTEWLVETDRGTKIFATRQAHENARRPFSKRVTLTDIESNRYDIADIDTLDPASRKLLEQRV
jgi:hypothetical protein